MAEPLQDHMILSDFIGTDAMDEIIKHLSTMEFRDFKQTSKEFDSINSQYQWNKYLDKKYAKKDYDPFIGEVFSCGIVLFAMVCGFLPFEDPDSNVVYKQILKGKLHFSS